MFCIVDLSSASKFLLLREPRAAEELVYYVLFLRKSTVSKERFPSP